MGGGVSLAGPLRSRDDSLEDSASLPPPQVIAREIVEDLEAALTEFAAVAESLSARERGT